MCLNWKYLFFLFAILLAVGACRKPFQPGITTAKTGYLVVEGVINSGSDSTIIKLSRTTKLADKPQMLPETGAKVVIESDANDKVSLTEPVAGKYVINALNLSGNKKYRLHITTSNGKDYLSDMVENKQTPDIDSVTYQNQKNGVQFLITSHDETNKTRYYRWDYEETWTYFSKFSSQIDYVNNQVVVRHTDSLVNTCYKHDTPSNSIFVATSNKLSKDVISNYPLGYVDASSGKISHIYSLLVKQYGISASAFEYWTNLKKNTEQLGSIFDAEPSTTGGNIHCTSNPGEPVLGFISVSTVKYKRIFVSGRDLPFYVPGRVPPPDDNDCGVNTILLVPSSTLNQRLNYTLGKRDSTLIDYVVAKGTFTLIGYNYAATPCVDCRVLGGTNIKPSYWPF